jgi:hypothetical protein
VRLLALYISPTHSNSLLYLIVHSHPPNPYLTPISIFLIRYTIPQVKYCSTITTINIARKNSQTSTNTIPSNYPPTTNNATHNQNTHRHHRHTPHDPPNRHHNPNLPAKHPRLPHPGPRIPPRLRTNLLGPTGARHPHYHPSPFYIHILLTITISTFLPHANRPRHHHRPTFGSQRHNETID